jgi:hypothetical protein
LVSLTGRFPAEAPALPGGHAANNLSGPGESAPALKLVHLFIRQNPHEALAAKSLSK